MQSPNPIFLTAHWQNLIMINYEIDPEILVPHLPPYTQLDSFNNKTLVSMVGFMFADTRVFGLRWPFHTNFEEVNLRFYVKHFDGVQWKRGVVFISEIVPRQVIAFMANAIYHEHYTFKRMRHSTRLQGDESFYSYSWKHGSKWNVIEATAKNVLRDIKAGSEEEFIFEHYWGYNTYNTTTTIEYGVEHLGWQVQPVQHWKLECDVAALYGKEFVTYLSANPWSVFLSKGSPVVIRKPTFIKKADK
jgi:uncharacterized protein YqjF (DUF2071 family)